MVESVLEKFRKEIETCTQTRCGVCVYGAPCFKKGGFESTSPKGYMRIALGLLEGEIEISDTLKERLTNCTMCGYCDRRCGIEPSKIVEALKSMSSM